MGVTLSRPPRPAAPGPNHAAAESRPGLAAVWMTGAIVSFTSMAVAGRFIATELDTFELMMYRALVGILLVTAVAYWFGTLGQINTRKLHLHLLRNIFHFTGQNLWFFGVTMIPLAQLFALEFTAPLWIILMSPIFLGEVMTRVRAVAAAVGFIGILIVARPDFGAIDAGILAGVSCAIGFAGSIMFTKLLTRTATVTCILFWLVTMQAAMGLVTAGWDGDIAIPSMAVVPWLAVVAVGGLVAHLSITKALTLAPASIVSPLDFARLPVVAIVGMLVFDEPFDPYVMLGALLIFGANYTNLRTEARMRRAALNAR
jgi:drug/metabolite transporter (DMT)-like permease